MSKQSNNLGRAYEYVCLETLYSEIKKYRNTSLNKEQGFEAAKRAWESIPSTTQKNLLKSARSFVSTIFDLEPRLLDGNDNLELLIQVDAHGEEGDVRDILVIRSQIQWEIGFSIKHNNFAVKHSRLSPSIDFGEKWFGYPCSSKYHDDIKSIFKITDEAMRNKRKWSELIDKSEKIYLPLLNAFMDEINRKSQKYKDVPRKLVQYLLGEYDFYKIISIDPECLTRIQAYNLRGTLNKDCLKKTPKIHIKKTDLPSRIIFLQIKPGSKTTVELCLDKGWQFNFRIHNASTYVENSLKFDVQIVGMPATIISIDCKWDKC